VHEHECTLSTWHMQLTNLRAGRHHIRLSVVGTLRGGYDLGSRGDVVLTVSESQRSSYVGGSRDTLHDTLIDAAASLSAPYLDELLRIADAIEERSTDTEHHFYPYRSRSLDRPAARFCAHTCSESVHMD
jgi:hypothetical protein